MSHVGSSFGGPASSPPNDDPSAERAFEDAAKVPLSPEVHDDGRVTVRCYAPEAKRVELVAGAMQIALGDKPVPLDRGPGGLWSATVGPLPPDIYDYGFAIDGGLRTLDTANCDVEVLKWGSLSLVEVSGDAPAFYDPCDVPHGQVRMLWYASRALGRTRRVLVYTPPGFEEVSDARLPVLYLLHGAGQEETSWLEAGRANFILDNLIASGEAAPMLTVMPYGHARRRLDTDERIGFGEDVDRLRRDFFEELMPLIASRFPVADDPRRRAVAGLSMGGGQAARYGLVEFGRFAWVGLFSGVLRGCDSATELSAVAEDAAGGDPLLRRVFVGCGEQEAASPQRRELNAFLERAGVPLEMHTYPGEHTFQCWRRCLRDFAKRIFRD